MPRNPEDKLISFSDAQAERMIKLYTAAERDILNEINKALLKGNKTEYLKAMRDNVQAILKDLKSGSRTWCEDAIPRVYTEAIKAVDDQIGDDTGKLVAGFSSVHQQAAQVLADSAFTRFDDVVNMIGRRTDDIYRTLALENVRSSVLGIQSWQKVARNYREQLADQGVTGFRDRANRQWNMRSYTEMVSRTTTMEAHLEGTKNRLLERGHHLVKVSTHSNPCPKCAQWQGKVLSLDGQQMDQADGTLDEAKASGLFHPRCKHAYGLYIDLEAEIERLEKGLNANKGLSAGDKTPSGVPDHKMPVNLESLKDLSSKAVTAKLAEYEKIIVKDKIENAVVITADGEVWKCFGDQERVYPDHDLGDKLFGASVTHNHVSSETRHSFSDDDIELFMKYNLAKLRGVDNKYSYELNRDRNDIELETISLHEVTKENWAHEWTKISAIKLGIGYRRWLNEVE